MEPADRPLIRWKLNPERVRFALEEAPSLRVRNGIARPSWLRKRVREARRDRRPRGARCRPRGRILERAV